MQVVCAAIVSLLDSCWRVLRPCVRPCAEGHYLQEQAKDIKRVSDYVSQLRRVGKGLGVFEFDKYLSEEQEDGDVAA